MAVPVLRRGYGARPSNLEATCSVLIALNTFFPDIAKLLFALPRVLNGRRKNNRNNKSLNRM
jgi:hypothetical protein